MNPILPSSVSTSLRPNSTGSARRATWPKRLVSAEFQRWNVDTFTNEGSTSVCRACDVRKGGGNRNHLYFSLLFSSDALSISTRGRVRPKVRNAFSARPIGQWCVLLIVASWLLASVQDCVRHCASVRVHAMHGSSVDASDIGCFLKRFSINARKTQEKMQEEMKMTY